MLRGHCMLCDTTTANALTDLALQEHPEYPDSAVQTPLLYLHEGCCVASDPLY